VRLVLTDPLVVTPPADDAAFTSVIADVDPATYGASTPIVEPFELYNWSLDPESYPPVANAWLVNEPGYLVNKLLTRDAPPPVPSDPDRWRFFLYFGAEDFGVKAAVPVARREEFERLLLKIRPAQQWIVTLVDYV
jgi:hypothetical protein